ncbi:MAG: type II/IV secretion system protein [Elusimicrobia bacterium]|nr:type II/IV secretion system protein [Elusimicrobiota bacterium]
MFEAKPPAPAAKPVVTPETPFPQAWELLTKQPNVSDANEIGTRLASLILLHAIKVKASDIHFDPHGINMQVRLRIDGQLVDLVAYERERFPITSRLRVLANFSPKAASVYTPEDGRFDISTPEGKVVQFRASAFPVSQGDKLVLRVLNMGLEVERFEDLGFEPAVREQLDRAIRSPSGIFFLSGLTGSGKSTTLCSILRALSRPEVNVMTLEDPVEYELPRVNHSQINPKAGFSFADGLRSILRQDPNIIMVGEVRDLETAEIAMRAALTGHLIFTTIHATTAVGVVHRLISMGIEPYMITASLIGSLAQRLVRKVCAGCVEPQPVESQAFERLLKPVEAENRATIEAAAKAGGFKKGRGCQACRNTGYKGRIGVFELLIMDDLMRGLVSSKADPGELKQAASKAGVRSLLTDALLKAARGLTTLDEVVRVV